MGEVVRYMLKAVGEAIKLSSFSLSLLIVSYEN